MYMFLEDKNWERANEYAEKALDIDPQTAEAYLGELLAELHIEKFENLCKHSEPIDNYPLLKNAYRFADNELKAKLDAAVAENEKIREETRMEKIYSDASEKEKASTTESDFLSVANIYEKIPSYKDSAERAKQCREKAEFQRKEKIYVEACNNLSTNYLGKISLAIEAFKTIPGFKDTDKKIIECEEKIPELKQLAEKQAKKRKKNRIISSVTILLVIIIGVSIISVISIIKAAEQAADQAARAGFKYEFSNDGTYCKVIAIDDNEI